MIPRASLAAIFLATGFTASAAPTDLSLSPTTVSLTAPVSTVVGSLATTDPAPGGSFTYALVPGEGDAHNAEFDISGDQLIVNRDLSIHPAGTELTVRIRTSDLALQSFEKAFLIEVVKDVDGDGLDDAWELLYFPNLGAADGSGNADGDLLANLEEQAAGTSPILADTDGDGLDDHLEDGTGIFNGPADPGSDPLRADTDGDGLDDGLEVSTSNGHVTNPNLADSDGDTFRDPVEIAEGTNPNDASDFPTIALPLVLNEILGRNDTGLEDGFGTREDWIEIHNPNPHAVNLGSYYLTDNPLSLTKWNFPLISIPANGYRLVFASGLDTVDPLGHPHTNFKMESGGEYLGLVRSDGRTIDDAFDPAFPEQFADISYGPQAGDGARRFFATPTPGAPNGGGFPGVVKDTNFDMDRGFHTDPFLVAITSDTPDAVIRYTTNGALPSATRGRVYSQPVQIRTTTTLRAIAYKPGWLPTNVDSQTYIFVDDVARQPANPRGWPSDWANSGDPNQIHPADYEMDPRVVDNVLPGYSVPEALLDIPSVSIAMEPDDFLTSEAEPATGIYSYPASRWERRCSIEYLHPDGTPGFQHDAKIEVHGNASRRPARMHKHSLRITFTTEFGGPGKLRYPLFPDSPVDEFNKLVLRACFTDSWGLVSWGTSRYRPNDSQYFRDVWMKESLRDMGQPSSYGNFVHLYVNGLYFGLHNLTERLEDDFFAEHLGGAAEDWHVNADFSSPGSRWNRMLGINVTTPAGYAEVQNYVDLENYADYMLLHFYADAEDWPTKNGYAAANPVSGDGRYRFFVWDQEIMLDYHGRAASRIDSGAGGGALFQRLRASPEFRLLFADRVRKHCFNDGALSLAASQARYLDIANRIDKAIVAESARWGDTQATTPYGNSVNQPSPVNDFNHIHYPPALNYPNQSEIYFTREANWLVERDNVINNYLPAVHNTRNSYALLNILRNESLYPRTNAPDFALHGGVVPSGFELGVSGTTGTIYYTTDGSDPRLEGGRVSRSAGSLPGGAGTITLTGTGTVKARSRNGNEWSALTEADFIVGTVAGAASLAITEIMYNPVGAIEDTEFLELMNIDPAEAIDLTGVSFTAGITYTFPAGVVLPPMGRLVLVADRAAFAAAYPGSTATLAPGTYTGNLSNSGETITLRAHDGGVIRSFAYGELTPWPESPDGLGDSLALVAPERNPDHTRPENWRASVGPGGTPGGTDATGFAGDPHADLDRDGRSRLFEYATGTSDGDPNDDPAVRITLLTLDDGGGPADYLAISHTRNLAADDVLFQAQMSTDLSGWTGLDTIRVSEVNHRNGTSTVTWRSTAPFATRDREFLRLHVSLR